MATDKPVVWLYDGIKRPPFSKQAQAEAGGLLRQIQQGGRIGLPGSRPMPDIGPRCHELRVRDEHQTWRVIYRIDADAIVVAAVFSKKPARTPGAIISSCRHRLRHYDEE